MWRELVGDDALQLLAVQDSHGASGHAQDRVLRREAGGEGVDAVLFIQEIDRGNGKAGRDGHLLDDVEKTPFRGIRGVGVDRPSAEESRHGMAAVPEPPDLVETAGGDDQESSSREDHEAVEPTPIEGLDGARRDPHQEEADGEMDAQYDGDDREREVEEKEAARLARLVLMLEEIHLLSALGPHAPAREKGALRAPLLRARLETHLRRLALFLRLHLEQRRRA